MTAIMHRETNTLALAGQAMQLFEFGAMLVKSKMLPNSVQTPEAAVAIIVKGMELGLPPMAALNGITIIQGKPTVSPQLMLSLINRAGILEDLKIETGPQGASCMMKRRGRTAFTASFGPAEAKAMGLDGKDNYRKQAPVMYQWRAVAACSRVVAPDVIDGLYTPEEMGADVQVDEDGGMTVQVVQEAKPVPAPQQAQARTVDVTRQVAQATNPNAALEAWVVKIGEAGTKINGLGGRERAVAALAHFPDWRRDVEQARAGYEALCEVGRQLKEEQAAPAPDAPPFDVAPAEAIGVYLINAQQLKVLQGHMKRVLPLGQSADRAAFYHWFKPLDVPAVTRTKDLTEAQAELVIHGLAELDNDAAEQTGAEFMRGIVKAAS